MKIALLNNIPTKYRKDLFIGLYQFHTKKGNELKVYYLSEKEKVRNEKISLEKFEKTLPVFFQFRNFLTPTSDLIINYKYIRELFAFDVLIVFGYSYLTYLVIATIRRLFNKNNILYSDTTILDSNNNFIKSFLKSIILKSLFNKFVVPGVKSNQYIQSFKIYRNIFIAPQYSPLRSKKFIRKEKNLTDKYKLLYVGRLAKEKQILKFVNIFNEIESDKFELTIVGNGPLEKDIKMLSNKNINIRYLGYIQNDEKLKKIYQENDILVLTSLSEPWGLVVNEAINHGLALLLSNNVGSHPDLLDGNGLIFDEFTTTELKNCLKFFSKHLNILQAKSYKISLNYTRTEQINGFNRALGII